MKILVVDDSAVMRTIVRSTIEVNSPAGKHEVIEAANGEDALRLIREAAPRLVLLDWNMPKLDGLTLVRRLRAEGNDVPVLMITAVVSQEHLDRAIRAGVSELISKPFRMTELWDRMSAFLD